MVTYHQKSNFVSLDGVPTEFEASQGKNSKSPPKPCYLPLVSKYLPPPLSPPPPSPLEEREEEKGKKTKIHLEPPLLSERGMGNKKIWTQKTLVPGEHIGTPHLGPTDVFVPNRGEKDSEIFLPPSHTNQRVDLPNQKSGLRMETASSKAPFFPFPSLLLVHKQASAEWFPV